MLRSTPVKPYGFLDKLLTGAAVFMVTYVALDAFLWYARV